MVDRIKADELDTLANASGYTLDGDERIEIQRIVEAIIETIELVDTQDPELPAPIEAVRDPGRRPAPGEDPLNAIVRYCLVRADAAEGLLSGVRVAVKDAVAIAGIPLTGGSRVLQGFVPTADSVVADRILRAGGEIVAITNMDDLAFSGGGDSSWYGPTLNPWDEARTAAGSSGGSAAALFYDGIDVAIGGDQGGSIRAPASWCGVLGLKPTHSLVPYTDIVGIDQTFDHCGPMAGSTAELAALLQAIAGADSSDPRQRDVRKADYLEAVASAPDHLEGLRIGIVAEGFAADVGAEPEVVAAVRGAIERLRTIGAEPVDVSLPEHPRSGGVSFAGFVEGMTNLLTSGGNGYAWAGRYWEELAPALAGGLRDHAQELSPQVKATLVVGRYLRERYASVLYARAQNLRPWLRSAYERALTGVDVLLLPTTPGRPHLVDPSLPISDRVLRGWANLANTAPTNMTGHPALSLPLAEADGLPVGVMLVARHFEDDRLLSVAATCERALGWRPARGA